MGKFMCTVWQKADSAAILATLKRKWSSSEVKMAHLALESIRSLAPGSVNLGGRRNIKKKRPPMPVTTFSHCVLPK